MQPTPLALIASWSLFVLGVAHVAFGLIKFKGPLLDALRAGFVGQFSKPEIRRTAFWFAIFGLPLMLAGHTAIHAAGAGDLALLKIVAVYSCAASMLGMAAFPRSPFAASFVVSLMLLGAGYGV